MTLLPLPISINEDAVTFAVPNPDWSYPPVSSVPPCNLTLAALLIRLSPPKIKLPELISICLNPISRSIEHPRLPSSPASQSARYSRCLKSSWFPNSIHRQVRVKTAPIASTVTFPPLTIVPLTPPKLLAPSSDPPDSVTSPSNVAVFPSTRNAPHLCVVGISLPPEDLPVKSWFCPSLTSPPLITNHPSSGNAFPPPPESQIIGMNPDVPSKRSHIRRHCRPCRERSRCRSSICHHVGKRAAIGVSRPWVI